MRWKLELQAMEWIMMLNVCIIQTKMQMVYKLYTICIFNLIFQLKLSNQYTESMLLFLSMQGRVKWMLLFARKSSP
jgi:hypothetical protein